MKIRLPLRLQVAAHVLRGHPVMYRTRIRIDGFQLLRQDRPGQLWIVDCDFGGEE